MKANQKTQGTSVTVPIRFHLHLREYYYYTHFKFEFSGTSITAAIDYYKFWRAKIAWHFWRFNGIMAYIRKTLGDRVIFRFEHGQWNEIDAPAKHGNFLQAIR